MVTIQSKISRVEQNTNREREEDGGDGGRGIVAVDESPGGISMIAGKEGGIEDALDP